MSKQGSIKRLQEVYQSGDVVMVDNDEACLHRWDEGAQEYVRLWVFSGRMTDLLMDALWALGMETDRA